MKETEVLLSIVVVSRNDDHGGNMLERMQLFVSGWIEQAKRFRVSSELIIVEWNPPKDKPGLAQALSWPDDTGPCEVRIIQVPPELHSRYKCSEKLPLFQMIGKNVGIRRAKGRFVLATNIDILFSDELMEYFASGKLENQFMYRIDRYDVPSTIPVGASIETQLEYCREHLIRINARAGTIILSEKRDHSVVQTFMKRFQVIQGMNNATKLIKDAMSYLAIKVNNSVIMPLLYGKRLHTNACGDFTLMAREHWFRLRGNAEFETFSLYLDGLMCAVAHHGGTKEKFLAEPLRIYHLEHAPGSGWAPGQGATLLDKRLKKAGISQLSYKDYLKYLRRIRWHKGPVIFNDENWGLGMESLKEYEMNGKERVSI